MDVPGLGSDVPETPFAPPAWVRAVLAVAGGLLVWLTFPDHGIHLAGVPGVALVGLALWGVRARAGFGLGMLAGWATFLPTLHWSGIFVGAMPWVALSTVQALYVAVMGAVLAAVQRPLLARGRVVLAALALPVLWVLQELVRGTVPFGGFPWARLAFGQADSPLARWAWLGGAPLISLVVALLAVPLVLLVVRRTLRAALLVPVAVALGLTGLLLPVHAEAPEGSTPARIGMVQGNVPRAGLDFNAERRQVLDNHVTGTEELGRSGERLDLVVWPENSSDIDPLRNPDAAAQVQRALDAVDVPVVVGAILDEPSPEVSNASLLYEPGRDAPTARYVKQHPVPFAEYVPYRDFFRLFSDKVDLVRVGFAKGPGPQAFPVEGSAGGFSVVPTICFEVAYDGLMREAVHHAEDGGLPSVLLVQTNNATFGYTAESTQQLAISRIRAIEHGRPVAHVSTVGVSAVIAPDGSVTQPTELFTAAQVVGTVDARTGLTPSDRLGPWVEIGSALALVLLAVAGRLRGRRADKVDTSPKTKLESSARA